MAVSQKELVEELRIQWKRLWQERVDDKLRAEGIATENYSDLFVEKGTIVHATRNFKSLNFKEILEKNRIADVDRVVSPDPKVGGWGKFIKMNVTKKGVSRKRRAEFYSEENKREKQHPKKGGRGWLHR